MSPEACKLAPSLGRYFDGELSLAEVGAFEAHLPECGRCQAGLEELFQLDALGQRALKLQKRGGA